MGSAPDPAKQGAVGRLGNVTKLLQRQQRESLSVQWPMQDFVNREAFRPFSEEPTWMDIRGIIPGKFSNQLHRNRRRKTAAPPPLEKL